MLRHRVIPVLLLRGGGLVKTRRFQEPVYLGDAINAISIFNEKRVDELVVLDIDATTHGYAPRIDLVQRLASECFMPLAYGGGVTRVEEISALFAAGAEKVSLNAGFLARPKLVSESAALFGSQSIVVSLDYRVEADGTRRVYTRNGRVPTGRLLEDLAREAANEGAGEILIQCIDRDGSQAGYDVEGIRSVTSAVDVPVVASGGAGSPEDLAAAIVQGGASGAAAGAMFVFIGRLRAVLINVPPEEVRDDAIARLARSDATAGTVQ
jgi:cyclase